MVFSKPLREGIRRGRIKCSQHLARGQIGEEPSGDFLRRDEAAFSQCQVVRGVAQQSVSPGAFPLTLSLFLVMAIVIGGLGRLVGAFLGALLLVALPAASAAIPAITS